jgi:hypothetical protein
MQLTNRRHVRSSAASRRHTPRDVVLLRDLDPGRDVRGGAGKQVFGEASPGLESDVERRKAPAPANKERRHDKETR